VRKDHPACAENQITSMDVGAATYAYDGNLRDYAASLIKDKDKSDCLKLSLLIYKAGQVSEKATPLIPK